MADVRMNLEQAAADADFDPVQIAATTEADIRRHMVEDGEDPDDPMACMVEILSPAEIRRRAGLTQAEIAEHLRVPVATWLSWEQERASLDPAVRSLLNAVANDPERTFRAIGGRDLPPEGSGRLDRMLMQTDAQFLLSLLTDPKPTTPDGILIPNETTRFRRIREETRFDAVLEAVGKRSAA